MYTRVRKTIGNFFTKTSNNDVHFFNQGELNIRHYSQTLHSTIGFVVSHLRNTKQPFSGVSPAQLKPYIDEVDLNVPLNSMDMVLKEVKDLYTQHAIAFHLPSYIAHLNCPVLTPTLAAEAVLTALNSSLDTWDQSAGGTLMEMKLIDWTCSELGLGANSDGVFTSGGTQSNLMGVLLARDYFLTQKLGVDVRNGLPVEAKRFRIFTSELSHFSLKKASNILGLGENSVITVPVDKSFKMDVVQLRRLVEEQKNKGNIPLLVVGTAGTTDLGSVDPLEKIAALAKEYGMWFHADAAYGCGLMLTDKHKPLLKGIENADSVTVDYHKSFFQPVSSSAVLVKNKEMLRLMCYHADYLNPVENEKNGYPDQVNKTIQTTRRFDALKLWFTLRALGKETLGEYIDQIMDLSKRTASLLRREECFELLNNPETSIILFRYNPHHLERSSVNGLNQYIRKKLMESGKALVASTKVNGELYLKFTILNPVTTIKDITIILDQIKSIANEYAANN